MILARAWETRWVILVALVYLIVVGWLFSAGSNVDIRPVEIFSTPAEPKWSAPGGEHRFGTTGTGLDLFHLCRIAMAQTVAVSAIAGGLGLALAFLSVMLFAFDPGDRRFSLMKSFGRVGTMIPCSLLLLIILAGSGGGMITLAVGVGLLVAWHLGPTLAEWFEEAENRQDVVSAYVLGLSRTEIVSNRIIPATVRKMVGVFAVLVPQIALLEMGVTFLGFGSDRLSIGGLVAYGREVIIEAPWLAIYPGIFAGVTVAILSLLGWLTSRFLRSGGIHRFL